MSATLCRLCLNNPAIENSHVISKLVLRAIKTDSQTGFLRNPYSPNMRLQDGDKFRLLCPDCEQRFGNAENQFAQNIFLHFHKDDRAEFEYGPWLHYFMTSLAWRTLILDLPGLESDEKNPRQAIKELNTAAETMRIYLLGADHLAASLRNHAVVWVRCDSASEPLAAAGPNVLIRRSVGGYTVLDRRNGYSAVFHNLAGFLCFLIIKGNPRDIWQATKVNPRIGELTQPQRVSSWLIHELLSWLIECGEKQKELSEKQFQVIASTGLKKPPAPSLRFWELDKKVRSVG